MTTITSRKQAGLPPSGASRRPLNDVVGLTWHYSTGQELGAPGPRQWVRNIYDFHTGPQRGWDDIAYHFLIDMRSGEIIRGRPLDRIGAHSPAANRTHLGICFLGNDDPGVRDVTDAAWASARELVRSLERVFTRTLTHEPHRAQRSTACPGDEIAARIRTEFATKEHDMVPPLVIYAQRGVDFSSAAALVNAAGLGMPSLDPVYAQWCLDHGSRVIAVGGASARDLTGEVEAVGNDGLASLLAGGEAV